MTSNCQCGSHPPAKPQAVELAKLEAVLADCRARKAKAAPGTPMPLIACLADKAAELKAKPGTHRQVSAEFDRLKAENASLRAQIASAKPAALTAAAYLASVAKPTMTRAEFSRLPRGEQGKAIKTITLVP